MGVRIANNDGDWSGEKLFKALESECRLFSQLITKSATLADDPNGDGYVWPSLSNTGAGEILLTHHILEQRLNKLSELREAYAARKDEIDNQGQPTPAQAPDDDDLPF